MNRSAFLLGLLFLGAAAGCTRQEAAPPTMQAVRAEGEPDQESWGARFQISEAGLPRVEIRAGYMAKFERQDSTYTLLRGAPDSLGGGASDSLQSRVRAYLFDAAGDSSATLWANQLLYYEYDGRYEARGGVVVVTPEGKRLETEHLVWDEAKRKVRTPGFVRITTPRERIQGYRLVADEDLETYTLAQVTGQVTLESDGEADAP